MSLKGDLQPLDLRYKQEASLGHGASGHVYKAWDQVAGKVVALKRYDGAAEVGALGLRQKFWRWARLSHPNLVKLLDFGTDSEGTPLLVMELADGQDLAQLGRTRHLSIEEVASVVRDAARGLSHLHQYGLVHGDIKPANCILTPDGLKLVDWGGDRIGTLAYMRPERLHGAQPSMADDLYALGLVGMELLLDVSVTQVSSVKDMLRLLAETKDESAQDLVDLLEDLATGKVLDPDECLARLSARPTTRGEGSVAFRAEVPLVARHSLIQELTGTAQSGQAWLIIGEAGIGKSRFAREVLHSQKGHAPLVGYCKPGAGGSLQPWREALMPLALRVVPTESTVSDWLSGQPHSDKQSLFEAIATWLDDGPDLQIVIEDLQWADQVSLELFHFLAARLTDRGTHRLLATSRPATQIEPLVELRRIRMIRLTPLDRQESTELLAAHIGASHIPPTFVQWAFELTGGNPLHLGELAAHLTAENYIRLEGGTAQFPGEPPSGSPGLQALVVQLATRFSSDAHDLLLWGTVLGKRFSLDLLHQAVQWPEERLFAAVEELCQGRFWIQTDAWLDFRHDRLRESLQDAWPADRIRDAHMVVARVLEQSGAAPGLLAYHFDHGHTWNEAFENYRLAGDKLASQGALGDAVAAWRRALELLDEVEGELPADAGPEAVTQVRFDLWDRLGLACSTIDPAFGIQILSQARRRLLAEAPLAQLGSAVASSLEQVTGADLAAPYHLSSPGHAPEAAWPVLFLKYHLFSAFQGICHVVAEGPEPMERCLAEAETLLPSKEHWLRGALEIPRCTALAWQMRFGEAGPKGKRAWQYLEQAPVSLRGTLAAFRVLAYLYQLAEAHYLHAKAPNHLVEASLVESRAAGLADFEGFTYVFPMGTIGISGRWDDFIRAEGEFERELERCGLARTVLGEGLCYRMVGWFEQGHWDHVAKHADALPPFLKGSLYETWFLAPVAMALCAVGRIEEAAEVVKRIEADAGSPWWGRMLAKAWLAVARGDVDAEQRLSEVLQQEGPGPHYHPMHCMWALRLRADLRSRHGLDAEAQADLEQAMALADMQDNPLQRAITLFWMGRLARDGETRERHFASAEALFKELGNPHYPLRIQRERKERWWVLTEGSSRPLPDVRGVESTLRTVVEQAMSTAKADRGKLLFLDSRGDMTTRVSLTRPGIAEVEAYSHTVANYVLETGQSLWLADVTRDERFQRGISLVALDLRTVICVPLRWGDRLRGLLYLDRQEASEAFTREDFRLVEALAGYGALALAHAEVAEQEQQQRKQAEVLLGIAKALRLGEPERLREDIAALTQQALGCRHVAIGQGSEVLDIDWGASQGPNEEQKALASGIAEFAALALERAELQAREAESRLRTTLAEELSKEREALIHQILHDLRNSVQAIALMNMDLAYWAQDKPDASSSVAAIESQVSFMSTFLKQKLDLLVAGRNSAEEVDLDGVIDDLKNRFEPLCASKHQVLEFQVHGNVRLAVPQVELIQILGNLLDNAGKFTPEGGRITVEGQLANGWATISIQDTGPGFVATQHSPFKGYGLGLPHVRQLVKQAGGWLTQEDGSEGAIVRIGLPTPDWGKAQPSVAAPHE